MTSLANPKEKSGANWYSYYAGYSEKFVLDVLTHLGLSSQSHVLDPWNGSGTTTAVAAAFGMKGTGYDLNPVMVVVGKARLLDSGTIPSIRSIGEEILREGRILETLDANNVEPLTVWFCAASAKILRAIERGIQRVLVSPDLPRFALDSRYIGGLSTLACFFYVVLFRTVRAQLTGFFATNPTWIKSPSSMRNRLRPSQMILEGCFRKELEEMILRLEMRWQDAGKGGVSCLQRNARVEIADSTCLPDADISFDAVVCSPPYCTRIDYAIATKAELAVLGLPCDLSFLALRRSLLGSTTIGRGPEMSVCRSWGRSCLNLLDAVRNHPSKASGSYYLRGFIRYFTGLYDSLSEISRVLKDNGICWTVVQDSYYKTEKVDLPRIVGEMAHSLGWKLEYQVDFRQARSKGSLNSRSWKFMAGTEATESALGFRKYS
jgi:SAM-dependent methyltransferase